MIMQDNLHILSWLGKAGFIAGLLAILFHFNVALAGVANGYRIVWADEFNGNKLDTKHTWNIETGNGGSGNNELEYNSKRSVTVEDGCLILTARREFFKGRNFTSGRVNTMHKFTFKHGMIEARVKIPATSNGLWPAFWLMGENFSSVGWPQCGEIDIFEMGNGDGIKISSQDRYFNGACHWGYYENGSYPNYFHAVNNNYSLQDGKFHTFTLVWDDDSVSMYLDRDTYPNNPPYYHFDISEKGKKWAAGDYFHNQMFIIFDLAVGGYFTGITSGDGITALDAGHSEMMVDYVRVYQKDNEYQSYFWKGGNYSDLSMNL
jgi:beta-glucanase (GH16 family)